jgi:hypothetical protein
MRDMIWFLDLQRASGMIFIHPLVWRQVHGARREASDSTTQLTVRPYHITRPAPKQS